MSAKLFIDAPKFVVIISFFNSDWFVLLIAIFMKKIYRLDLIRRAVADNDGILLDCLVAQLADAERMREILRAKGYGATGMTGSTTAAQVPCAPRKE